MKIQGQRPVTRPETVAQPRAVEPTRPGTAKGAAEVRVSGAAQSLADARAPERPDPARVARLRGMIERGELKVDHEKIADAMLREER